MLQPSTNSFHCTVLLAIFSGKTTTTNLKLINSSDFLKSFIEKRSLKNNISLQLLNVNGSAVKTSDKKIHNFSITKLGKKRQNSMREPIETIIIRAQQNFEVVGGLNPIQIEIEDDRIINTLKKYKNIVYKITPLGMLFPATVTNNTNQIFITYKELNGVKKSLLNDKISNWSEVKRQLVWTNVWFKDHKETNSNSHLCFPFITRSSSDLTNFSIFLQDDKNKKIEFAANEKKINIFNFQIDIFLA